MLSIDLSTTYLGLRLANPFIAGASPLSDHLDTVRRLEDGGCAAIVLHSLFEEQITQKETDRIRHMDRLDRQFATVVSYFPEPEMYALGPDEYLEHVRRVKAAVNIPVIGSLNGMTAEMWLKFARLIEQAGADALELNMYEVVTDLDQSGAAIEHSLKQIVKNLESELAIPLAIKLSPFFTAFGNLARSLDEAGAGGLVLFNRLLQPDIDIRHLAVWPHLELSSSDELLLRLRWLAILQGRVKCSLAVTGGRRNAERRHQGDPGGCRRGADGVGDSAPRSVLFHPDAGRTPRMDGSQRVRQRRRHPRPSEPRQDGRSQGVRARSVHSDH